MKLHEFSLINVIQNQGFKDYTASLITERIERLNMKDNKKGDPLYVAKIGTEASLRAKRGIILTNNDWYRKLALSDKSYKNLANYKVPTDIRFDVLRTLPNRLDIIQLSDTKCIKYIKQDNILQVCIYYTDKPFHTDMSKEIHTFSFYIDLATENIFTDEEHKLTGKQIESKKDLAETFYGEFMLCVTYIELTEVKFDICYSNTKRGHILKGNDLKNELSFNVIQVNTNWNITKLHIGNTFIVRGHFRLAPHGTANNKYYKFIFIDTYDKTGIIKRKAGKEVHK